MSIVYILMAGIWALLLLAGASMCAFGAIDNNSTLKKAGENTLYCWLALDGILIISFTLWDALN